MILSKVYKVASLFLGRSDKEGLMLLSEICLFLEGLYTPVLPLALTMRIHKTTFLFLFLFKVYTYSLCIYIYIHIIAEDCTHQALAPPKASGSPSSSSSSD